MRIFINDFEEEVHNGCTVEDAIRRWEENDVNLVVELNHCFVHPDTYSSVRLREGDRLELINPAFGG